MDNDEDSNKDPSAANSHVMANNGSQNVQTKVEKKDFDEWMVVERRNRR